jgi:hypothetical protein
VLSCRLSAVQATDLLLLRVADAANITTQGSSSSGSGSGSTRSAAKASSTQQQQQQQHFTSLRTTLADQP